MGTFGYGPFGRGLFGVGIAGLLKKSSLDAQYGLDAAINKGSTLDQQHSLDAAIKKVSSLDQQYALSGSIKHVQALNQQWNLDADAYPFILLKQVRYLCTLAGFNLPIEGFNGRLKSGEPSYLSVRVPDGKRFADEIAARSTGELVIIREGVMSDGSVKSDELARVNLETVRQDQGARNSTATLVGHKQTTNANPKLVRLEGVSYRAEYGGKRHIRCQFNQDLRPGDTAVSGIEEIVAGVISYNVSTNITTMEIAEA